MISEIIILILLIVLVLTFLLQKKIQIFFRKLGYKHGTEKRAKYESEPPLPDRKIIEVLENRDYTPPYLAHIAREAEKRESRSVRTALDNFHKETNNRYKT